MSSSNSSFVTAEVVSEDSILKWFKEGHSNKGKMHFLEQMKQFIEWLQNAEEGELLSAFLVDSFLHRVNPELVALINVALFGRNRMLEQNQAVAFHRRLYQHSQVAGG